MIELPARTATTPVDDTRRTAVVVCDATLRRHLLLAGAAMAGFADVRALRDVADLGRALPALDPDLVVVDVGAAGPVSIQTLADLVGRQRLVVVSSSPVTVDIALGLGVAALPPRTAVGPLGLGKAVEILGIVHERPEPAFAAA